MICFHHHSTGSGAFRRKVQRSDSSLKLNKFDMYLIHCECLCTVGLFLVAIRSVYLCFRFQQTTRTEWKTKPHFDSVCAAIVGNGISVFHLHFPPAVEPVNPHPPICSHHELALYLNFHFLNAFFIPLPASRTMPNARTSSSLHSIRFISPMKSKASAPHRVLSGDSFVCPTNSFALFAMQ